jgi:hypothetical protein
MVMNATTKKLQCYFGPEPCSGFTHFVNGTHLSDTCPKDRCCWNPVTNKGQCEPKGSKGCNAAAGPSRTYSSSTNNSSNSNSNNSRVQSFLVP